MMPKGPTVQFVSSRHLSVCMFMKSILVCLDFSVAAAASVVFDSVESSPNYDNSPNDLYIDERELIELPAPHQQDQGQINEPYQKRYYFNPMNLPYNLEQSASYSARVPPPGEKSTSKSAENRGPRLNRYYENLKPYYKLKEPIA